MSGGNRRIEQEVRAHLERSLDDMDPAVLARLAGARRAALRQRRAPRRWLAPGLALAASIMLAALPVMRGPADPALAPLTPIEFAVAEEPLELYEELEFYLWLEEQEV